MTFITKKVITMKKDDKADIMAICSGKLNAGEWARKDDLTNDAN